MNNFERCRRDCFLGIKAFQNIKASLSSFERLLALIDSDDHILLSSYFYMGIIRYSKPFLNSQAKTGSICYPTKHLKQNPTFIKKIHDHILNVRNTLVAHDDFEQIEPRVLSLGLTLEGADFMIPTSMSIANKCISHPSDLHGVLQIKEHVTGALNSVGQKLYEDMKKLRSISIEHPEQTKEAEKYTMHYGKGQIHKDGTHLMQPEYSDNEWLNPKEPDFSEIHNGFRYEKINLRIDFHGPERIRLPNGYEIEISPR